MQYEKLSAMIGMIIVDENDRVLQRWVITSPHPRPGLTAGGTGGSESIAYPSGPEWRSVPVDMLQYIYDLFANSVI